MLAGGESLPGCAEAGSRSRVRNKKEAVWLRYHLVRGVPLYYNLTLALVDLRFGPEYLFESFTIIGRNEPGPPLSQRVPECEDPSAVVRIHVAHCEATVLGV